MSAKIIFALLTIFFAIVIILSLAIALTSASASLANGVANAAASTALLTSQCLSGFMIIVSLIAGAALGVTGYRFLSERKPRLISPPSAFPVPYRFIWAQNQKPASYLPTGEQCLPAVYIPDQAQAEATNDEDTLFQNWGW